jgi:hypothetical protein
MHYVYCQVGGCLQTADASGYCEEHSSYQKAQATTTAEYLSDQTEKEIDALATQVGGSHYKDMKIQPVEYIHANAMPYMDGNVVKYISRHRNKNGAEDVRKAIQYCQMILQMEYGEDE